MPDARRRGGGFHSMAREEERVATGALKASNYVGAFAAWRAEEERRPTDRRTERRSAAGIRSRHCGRRLPAGQQG
jgi:hypothetical protein